MGILAKSEWPEAGPTVAPIEIVVKIRRALIGSQIE
jgi:hypothetical protein